MSTEISVKNPQVALRSSAAADLQPLRVGTKVTVKSADEILATLDSNGRFEGLPWMPQMVDLCGKSATIVRWVTSSCVPTEDGVVYGGVTDAVLLDVGHCDGGSFGGCQMGCPLIWKTAWLRNQVAADLRDHESHDAADAAETLGKLAGENAIDLDGRAKCQATQLVQITIPHRGSVVGQYSTEMKLNGLSMSTIATSFCSGVLGRLSGASAGISGDLKRTPVVDLQLQPGDLVKVKSKQEIIKTLNAAGKNRGLWFDPIMLRYCGQELTVTKRVTTLVDESTGQIRQLKVPSVVLDDLRCDSNQRRFCSRLLQLFWREAWLERV
jgi:hypothetical protein